MTKNEGRGLEQRKREKAEAARMGLERRIDETAVQWKQAQAAGDDARADSLKTELWLLVDERYNPDTNGINRKLSSRKEAGDTGINVSEWQEQYSNAYFEALQYMFQHFAPEEGQFTHLMSQKLKNARIDQRRYDGRHAPGNAVLNAPVFGREDIEMGDMLRQETYQEEARRDLGENLLELAASILNFSRSSEKKNNPERRMWYALFFTEDVTRITKGSEPEFRHERDIFNTMDTEYLDYYMSKQCRTCMQIARTPLKPYGQVVPGKSGEIPVSRKLFPADVSLAFLGRVRGMSVTGPARSNQKKFYDALKYSMRPSAEEAE